jgi:V/A-type H+-transporting ATPase subunit C
LSEALRRHLAHTLVKIGKFFRGNPERLWEVLVARWEVFNLKTILRGQAHGVPADEILDALVPAGQLQESDLQRLAQQPSPRATVDLLATWHNPYARPLVEAMPRYAEQGDLSELELALDRSRFARAFEQLQAIEEGTADMGKASRLIRRPIARPSAQREDANAEQVRKALSEEIDATNLLTLIRLSQSPESEGRLTQRYGSASPAPLLIKGGGLVSHRLFEYKEVPSLDALVRELRGSSFGDALARAEARWKEEHRLSVFEDEIESKRARQDIALFHHDPLSIGIAIAYVHALVDEIRNLRVIGRGKSAGWKREETEKELRLWPS